MCKACRGGCGRVLPLTEFVSSPRSPDGHTNVCRGCDWRTNGLAQHSRRVNRGKRNVIVSHYKKREATNV